MKIRNGFVSNSSSSSFIVFVGKDFKFTAEQEEDILCEVEACAGEGISDENLRVKSKAALDKAMEILLRGESIHSEGHDYGLISEMQNAFREYYPDLILTSVEMGSGGCEEIDNICTDKNIETIKKVLS